MCTTRGPFDLGNLICTRDHDDDRGHTFESTSADVRGQEKSDGGGSDD